MTPMQQPQAQQAQQLTPEQRSQLDTVSRQALGFLLEEENAQLILDKAQQGDPKQAVIDAMMPVMQAIWQSAEDAGVQMEIPVFLAAGIQVLSILAEMLAVSGVITMEEAPQFAQEVGMQMVEMHNAAQGGEQQMQEQPQEPQQPMAGGLAATAGGM